MFFIISFIGWCFEKVARYIVYNSGTDRGFLTMPLCPIYGFSILLIYLLLGTPYSPRIGVRGKRGGCLGRVAAFAADIFIYFLLATLIATAVELLTGSFFGGALGISLWNYESQPYNFGRYICLGFSILWGALITAFMLILWRPLYRAVGKADRYLLRALSLVLVFLSLADLAFNIFYMAKMGTHFNFL